MRRVRLVVGSLVPAFFALAAANGAMAIPVAEYDKLGAEGQTEFLAFTLQMIFKHYRETDPAKAACMDGVFARVDAAGNSELVTLILDEIDRARAEAPDEHEVERIVYGVTERECAGAK